MAFWIEIGPHSIDIATLQCATKSIHESRRWRPRSRRIGCSEAVTAHAPPRLSGAKGCSRFVALSHYLGAGFALALALGAAPDSSIHVHDDSAS